MAGWDGLHGCCPKRDMLLKADPGELNPKDAWPNEDGWLAAAATDPNNPLDAAVVDGEPKIDDGVLVAAGAPKIDDVVLVVVGAPNIDEVVVDAVPNIGLDDTGTVGLPNIDEFVVAEEPKTVVVWARDPKPPAVLVVVDDPNIDDTVVDEGVPNIDEVVVLIGFPKIDDEVVVLETPKIEDVVVALVGVPNIDDVVVAIVGVPNIEGVVVVFVVVPKIEGALDVFVEVLKIEEELFVFVGVLNIELLVVLVGVLKIEVALDAFVGVLRFNVWLVELVEFPKILVVFVEFKVVPKIEVLVDGISKTEALLEITGVAGTFSFSGVTGSDIIGVGLSETWEVVSLTLLIVIDEGTVLRTGVVLIITLVEDTGSLITAESVFAGSEKLNDGVAVVDDVEVKMDLVSAVVLEISSLDAVKLNVENDVVSGFKLKLKVANVASFVKTVSCLFFDLSSVPNPENMPEVSTGLDVIFDVSILTTVTNGESILFLIESAKLNVTGMLIFGSVISVFTVDTLVNLKGMCSFDSVVPEIISKVDFVETILGVLLKFKGVAVDDFKLKSTGSLHVAPVETILFPNNEVELKATGSLVETLKSNLFEKLLSGTDLGVEVLSTGFQIGVITVLVGKCLDANENGVVMGEAVIGVDITVFVCGVGINKGFLNWIKLGLVVNGNLVSETFCSLVL